MINVWSFDIKDFEITEYEKKLGGLPDKIREEITSYKYFKDRKSRLIAKLLVRKAVASTTGAETLLTQWKRDKNNKPYISGWLPFSISHSENHVVVAFGADLQIGIDIEFQKPIDVDSLITSFSKEEIDFIGGSENKNKCFYEIWAKKEAVLKALGIGIVNGLNEFSCLKNSVRYQGHHLHFSKLNIHPDYICYLASHTYVKNLLVRKLSMADL